MLLKTTVGIFFRWMMQYSVRQLMVHVDGSQIPFRGPQLAPSNLEKGLSTRSTSSLWARRSHRTSLVYAIGVESALKPRRVLTLTNQKAKVQIPSVSARRMPLRSTGNEMEMLSSCYFTGGCAGPPEAVGITKMCRLRSRQDLHCRPVGTNAKIIRSRLTPPFQALNVVPIGLRILHLRCQL